MILTIDVRGKEFQVTKHPEPKVDHTGTQRASKQTQEPLWSTQIVVTDDDGGEILSVTTEGEKPPGVRVGDLVDIHGLVAIPWATNGRSGVAYRADRIVAVSD